MRANGEGVSCQAGSGTVSAHALRLAREAFYFTFSSDETFRLFRLGKHVEILTILHYLLNKNSIMRLFGLRPVSGLRGQRGLANASPEHRKHLHWTCTNPAMNVQPLAAVVIVDPGERWQYPQQAACGSWRLLWEHRGDDWRCRRRGRFWFYRIRC